MGISGLLPFLKKSSTSTHIKEFKGCSAAIDAYCWLHKGAFSCADKLVKGEKTDGYVTYCMKMVNMLLSNEIKPILVFDGRHLPSKLVTEVKRRENRERYKIQAREYLRQGNTAKARECFQRCVDVTSAMALQLIKACRAKNVDCIVAPYEADAQLAYLNLQGIADLVITEDSDLLAFGCRRVFFKMDQHGAGVLIEWDKLYLSLGGRAEFFNIEKFRRMCILSGCDYLPSLPGIGLGKAFKFFSRATSGDINSTLCRVPSCLNMPQLEVTSEYRNLFVKADQTFLYQLVYDPIQRKLVPLNPYQGDVEPKDLPHAGTYLDDDVAFHLALGNLDVQNLERMDNYNPDSPSIRLNPQSIWSRNFSKTTLKEIHIKQEITPKRVVTRQTCAKVEFSVNSQSSQASILSDGELTDQYIKTEAPTSPVLSSRKRKRMSKNDEENLSNPLGSTEDSQESSQGSSQVTDSGCVSSADSPQVTEDSGTTPERKRLNPFFKTKSPGKEVEQPAAASPSAPVASKFSALSTFSQLRKRTADGEEIVTSSYFQTSSVLDVNSRSDTSKNPDGGGTTKSPINSAAPQPVTELPTPSGCRPSGLSRHSTSKQKVKAAAAAVPNGMRQLNLRDMFACKQ